MTKNLLQNVATPPSFSSNLGGIRQDYDKLVIEEAVFLQIG